MAVRFFKRTSLTSRKIHDWFRVRPWLRWAWPCVAGKAFGLSLKKKKGFWLILIKLKFFYWRATSKVKTEYCHLRMEIILWSRSSNRAQTLSQSFGVVMDCTFFVFGSNFCFCFTILHSNIQNFSFETKKKEQISNWSHDTIFWHTNMSKLCPGVDL